MQKTKKSVAKRFKLTARGKLVRRTPGFRHLLAAKSTKQKRRASKDKLVAPGHAPRSCAACRSDSNPPFPPWPAPQTPRVAQAPQKVLKYAKGYFGNKSKLFRYAKEAVQHAWQYAYRDRRKKKADWRGLWIVRLNAACRSCRHQLQPLHRGAEGRGHQPRPQGPLRPCGARRSGL